MITELTNEDIGRWVTYKPELENERGRILRYNNETRVAWVVYRANENWDLNHWRDYTAAATNYLDLYFN